MLNLYCIIIQYAKLLKIQTFAPAERAIKKKFLLGKLFFRHYESNKPGVFKIREMTTPVLDAFIWNHPSVISLR